MRDGPGLRGHSCDPQILLPFESAFTVVTFPAAGPHLSLGFDEDEDGRQGGGVLSSWGGEGRRKRSPEGPDDKLSCPTVLSFSACPSSPALRLRAVGRDRLGWWEEGGPAHPLSLPGPWRSWSPAELENVLGILRKGV